MEKTYTLKEAADLLGMTKPGIRYRLKVLGIPLEKDAFGRLELSEDALQWLRDGKKPESVEESGEKQKKEPEREAENTGKNSEESERIPESGGKNEKEPEGKAESAEVVALEVLREQCMEQRREIERLNAKLEAKERRIDELTDRLTEALAKAQILHAASSKMLQDAVAEDSQAEPEEDPDGEKAPSPQEPPQKKRGLWARLFGRD